MLEEQRRELEKLRAELETERARGLAERRRFAAQARQLREAAERERQQLVDHLRSKWEAQRCRELRQLQEEVLREREAEIRQLLRWKEAEMRQLQQLLHRERDGVVRQARDLQRQLAEELVNRGYCGRAGAPEAAAAQCRCRLQEVPLRFSARSLPSVSGSLQAPPGQIYSALSTRHSAPDPCWYCRLTPRHWKAVTFSRC